jgi:NTE family protein
MTTDAVSDYVSSLLLRLGVFPQADADLIRELTAVCSFLSVPGGVCICVEGEDSDAIYVVATGMFGAYKRVSEGDEILLNRMGSGEIIGEVGFITGEARTTTVRALRNSEVLRISQEDLHAVASRCPSVLFGMCATVIGRLQNTQTLRKPPPRPRSFCFVPSDATIDISSTMRQIADSLETFGKAVRVSKEQASGQTSGWFAELEQKYEYILLQGECAPTAWTKFCLRQCDCVLLVARGDQEAIDFHALGPGRVHVSKSIPLHLVLLWRDTIAPTKTTAWLVVARPQAHYHVRSTSDAARAGRLVAGRGVGLVLSGGGARGLAHVGVLSALRESAVPVDVIGGTSIGAVVAAVFALEWDLSKMAEFFADEFSRTRITDYAIPRIAVFSERRFDRTVGRQFRELCIEDAAIPFFCVSSNLTAGRATVHKAGRFSTWLRATTAIPGVFPPVIERNAVYVDGGVLNNLPANLIGEFGVGTVIAVDVSSDSGGSWHFHNRRQPQARRGTGGPRMLELLWRVGTIGSGAAEEAASRDCNIVLRPAVGEIGIFGWQAREQAIEAGYKVALEHLPEIAVALGEIL